MTPKGIDEVKRDVSDRFIGSGGLHGVGLKTTDNLVRLYVTKNAGAEQAELLKQIRSAYPTTKFEVIFDDRSSLLLD